MKLIQSFLLLAISAWLFSCKTQQRIPNYLERLTDTTGKGVVQFPELKIQKNDLLSIQIVSESTNPGADALYNITSTASGTSAGTNNGGYLVDMKGDIQHPKLGVFHVEGLTKEELAAQIRKRLIEPKELLPNPTVIIRFQNLHVTVMGEVGSQGAITLPGEKVTILEAIGLAGGITDYGLKNDVKILREADGVRTIGKIDLSSDSLFFSPYYILKQNDVVLVDPTPRKQKKANQDIAFQRVSFGVSILTALIVVYNFIVR